MKPRNDPDDKQLLRRQQREKIGPKDPRVRNDAYWALRHQGYGHEYAKRAFRDKLPRYYKEKADLSGEYLADIDPEELFIEYGVNTDLLKLAVVIRPDLTEEAVTTAPPRSVEYTIWSENPPGFGLRIRPSGIRSYIVMFRIKGRRIQGKITLGKAGNLPLDLAKRLAREVRIEALAGNDPRPMHKSGQLLRQAK